MEVEEHNEEIVKKEEEKKQKRDMDSDSEEDEDIDKDGKSKSQKALRALKKNKQGAGLANKIPTILPSTKCKLRLLQLQRVYDYLQIETEYVRNKSEAKKSEGGKDENELTIESIRGSPLNICTVEEIIDEDHVIISLRGVLQYLVGVASFVDRDLLEPNCSVLVNPISFFVVGIVPKNTSSSVDVMRVEKAPEETYADIGGLDEQIMEIKEAVELPLTHPELFDEIGVKPPKGVILYGEPGTGKTLLAKAVANKTSATFLRLVGSELIQKYAGEGPKLVRDIFSTAKDLAPSIVFIDEIDSIGTKRYDADSSGAREVQRTMLELLNQLDGFDDRGDVKVIMATNRIDTLDPALLRPGRIDRKIKLPLPDTEAKRRIFSIHTSKMSLDLDVNLDAFIEAKDDLSGADIRSICMEAGMMALKERRMKVNMADFEEAKKKTLFRKKSKEPEGLYLSSVY
ncbi:26S proteasome subunit [Blastocystis sp. subtype 4]|uniref:26S proteasome subunit n=1 Tax=Blastocystis sp. subtype 4 TaxID=944170 RepID=UPI000711CCDC|nr:26S proteasome subunit [Blastocystis sp. subtype 4]KNB44426.1 26S proteasome subunit [Blastocystis sp. subtype 4]|eukprot:XP_014527869.1 26S proteasome subunit [Blastocystis sp. subtype 4]